MKPPSLIVFEGVDAAGKSSVCEKFVAVMNRQGIPAKLLSFPGKVRGTIGELVYRLHHDPTSVSVDRISAASLQALHVAAHLDAIEETILPALELGHTVVLDRYWWSTWVYGTIGHVRMDVLDALIEAERLAWDTWQPSILFHVTRSTPLREEPANAWAVIQGKYAELRELERGKYPIVVLENEGTLDDLVQNALAHADE